MTQQTHIAIAEAMERAYHRKIVRDGNPRYTWLASGPPGMPCDNCNEDRNVVTLSLGPKVVYLCVRCCECAAEFAQP